MYAQEIQHINISFTIFRLACRKAEMGRVLGVGAIIGKVAGRMAAWISPAVPDDIRPALQQAQFESVRRQVPMLLSVAALNTIIIMAVCAHDGLPFQTYGWMSLLLIYCFGRLIIWSRILRKAVDPDRIPFILKMNVRASLIIVSLLGLDAAYTFVTGMFNAKLLIPVSLCFGAMAISHCLYTLRPAAIGAIIMGLFPSAVAMLIVGEFEAQMLGCSIISVGLLMIQFVAAQYDQLIARLGLEKQNHVIANTDALTGLANRRAIMAALDEMELSGMGFGVVLIDLDGFKAVNDTLGHHAGDMLLHEVGVRLSASVGKNDCVGRLGGDEFIIVLREANSATELSASSTALLAGLCRPVDIEGARANFGASLGTALFPADGTSIDALLKSADAALYAAKRNRSEQPARRVA
jgi:diguanylate cyclase